MPSTELDRNPRLWLVDDAWYTPTEITCRMIHTVAPTAATRARTDRACTAVVWEHARCLSRQAGITSADNKTKRLLSASAPVLTSAPLPAGTKAPQVAAASDLP